MVKRRPVFLVFKTFMAFAYLLLGVLILSSDTLQLPVTLFWRTLFGILLLLYGGFRIYTGVIKKPTQDEAN